MKNLTLRFRQLAKSTEYINVFKNFGFLSLIQVANYILPLLTLPYLGNVLGAEAFGHVMFAQAFVQYFITIVDYGFNFSATKEIALNKGDNLKVSEIFYAVIFLKALFFFISLVVLTVIVFAVDKFSSYRSIYFFTFAAVLGNVFFPAWLFQGLEKMKYITFFNVSSRIASTVFIFLFVHKPLDFIRVPVINAFAAIVPSVLSLWYLLRVFPLQFTIPRAVHLRYHLKRGWFIFLSSISSSLYSVSNTFFLGLLFGNVYAGYYSFAEKIIRACTSLFVPLNTALFPYISLKMRESPVAASALLRKIFFGILLITGVGSVVIYFGSDLLPFVISKDLYPSISVLKILSPLLLIIAGSNLIGFQILYTTGLDTKFLVSVFIAGLLNLLLCFLLSPQFSYKAPAYSLLISEFFIFCSFLLYARKVLFNVGVNPA